MPGFIAKRWSADRSLIGRSPDARPRRPGRASDFARGGPRGRAASEDGFLLIEVIVSALLVGMIVVATFTGFDVLNRSTADARLHDEAVVLAAQSQELLRTDPANILATLQTAPHTYTQVVGGTTFTIKQEAAFVNDKEPTVSCEAAGSKQSNQTGNYLRIASSVTWPQLGKRSPVSASSIISPPTGSAIELDVGNAPTPTAGVSGITAVAKYTAAGSGASGSLEATTGEAGCLVFGGIPATAATVEVPEKTGYVTIGGELQVPPKEVAIAPNITTHDHITFNAGGRIEAHFEYNGSEEYEGKHVTGDTFVVANSQIPLPPQFELGSTSLSYEKVGEERYTAATGTYKETAQTPTGEKYPAGDLFPFLAYPAEPEWSAYAGDCGENEPLTVSKGAVKPGKGTVLAGQPTVIKIPTSYVKLELLEGYFSKPGKASEQTFAASITNPKCAGTIPNNAAAPVTTKHSQKTISAAEAKGLSQLGSPFQPFGSFELCVYNEKEKRSDKISYENLTVAGSNPKIYLGEATTAERAARKVKEVKEEEEARNKRLSEEETARKPVVEAENAAKTKRATEEATAKTAKEKRETEEKEATKAKEKRATEEVTAKTAKEKREKEETEQTTARVKREKEEKEAREKWLAEEKQKVKPITKAQREAKEKEQTKTREADEKAEKTAKEKRVTEEAEAKTAKEKREKEEAEAPAAKTKREKEETEAKTAKEKRETEEKEATKAREKREAEEATARKPKEEAEKAKEVARTTREKEEEESAGKSKVTVESGNVC
jgi:DNA segregation ATPase FtsK/SpoIIIE-like protein